MQVLKCTSCSLATFKILLHSHFSFAVPSSITQITQDQNITEGHNVTLSCQVSGVPHQQCLGLSPVVSVTMDTCWRLHTLTGLKMVNTYVKPVMSVAIQQKRQLLMYSVGTWKRYPLLHAVSSISLSQYIDLLRCNVFAREACLFVSLASAR